MKKLITKEGIINALFFLTAFIFLIINSFGMLTIPGLIVAVIALYCSLTGRYLYSAYLGVAAAFGSFLTQFITTFCSYCTLAATAFLVGGLISLLFLKSKNITATLILLTLSVLSAILLVVNLPSYEQKPVIAQPVVITGATIKDNKPILYISPGCKSCKSVLEEFVKFDPNGTYWQPVIVPAVLLAQGEAILKDKGYMGEVKSSFSSPTRFVPLLEINGQYYQGKEITIKKIKNREEEGRSTAELKWKH